MRQTATKMNKFTIAMAKRNDAEIEVPIKAPASLKAAKRSLSAPAASAATIAAKTTTVEWPRAKKKPTATGRLPSCMSLRVTLSIAAM